MFLPLLLVVAPVGAKFSPSSRGSSGSCGKNTPKSAINLLHAGDGGLIAICFAEFLTAQARQKAPAPNVVNVTRL